MQMKNKAVEKFLFHGTSHDVVDAICFQNFDFRVCGKEHIFPNMQVIVTCIQRLIPKDITTCFLQKF